MNSDDLTTHRNATPSPDEDASETDLLFRVAQAYQQREREDNRKAIARISVRIKKISIVQPANEMKPKE